MKKQDEKENIEAKAKVEEHAPSKELEEYIEKFKRLQAEFANYIKRVEKEREDLIVLGKINIIRKLLNIHDAFDKALEQLKKTHKNSIDDEFIKGVEMIFNQFNEVLSEEGLKPILAEGQKLDPHKHEVILQVENDAIPEDVIVKEVQKGYTVNDKVIRYSKVCVCKNKNNNSMEDGKNE